LDLKLLNEILDVLDRRGIAEFELEEGGTRVRIRRAESGANAMAAPQSAPMIAPAPLPMVAAAPVQTGAPAVAAAPDEEAGLQVVKTPIVGTFYRAPDPNSPPFVSVGDRVRVGQVLCIVEAMKLMNEIEAEVAGTIVKVHQENGQPVQYGAPLFSIRADQ
jgi:acetyl-CoA carboxylase biotin carboxyl carrier protein